MNRPILFTILIFLNTFIYQQTISAQESYQGNNISRIPANCSEAERIKIAASITPSLRQLNWQKQELTTFLHFSINTFYDQEWGNGSEDPARFNPDSLDARQWVKVCKDAGSKCIILTCKHHDGFCLWPSKYTTHSVASSPWKQGKGDVVSELANACHESGIRFGIYLSPWDRHEKSYGSEAYNTHFINQLTELLTLYGPIAEVWFDGACGEGPNGNKQVYDWQSYYKTVRTLQPDAVIAIMGPDVRWVGTESGYGRETEWSVVPVELANPDLVAGQSQQEESREAFIPPGDRMAVDLGSRNLIRTATALAWYPSEVDVSIRNGWFWHEKENTTVKNANKLLDIFFCSIGRSSQLLLNIPPDRHGRINAADIASLKEWKRSLDETFGVNLAKNAKSTNQSSKGIRETAKLLDADPFSSWICGRNGPWMLEMDLQGMKTFDVLQLQENIEKGQRIEKFRLQALVDGNWQTLTSGTTIGFKRLLRFQTVTTGKIRLIIDECRMAPCLSEFGLYKLAGS
ncbi:MAG: alpha-L-fucosidase [Bacteroidetes bacterium]|nr:alpha-L-fucosidase [Bacteroidota bacterium]